MAEAADTDLLAAYGALLAAGDLTCAVSDALGHGGAMHAGMRPVWPGARLIGKAVTVQPLGTDLSAVYSGIEAAPEGSVLVIDAHGQRHSAFWGERTTRAALARGLRGAVIDGACRDVTAVTRLGFPVFSTGVTPNAGVRGGQGRVQVPVAPAGIPVQPGDLILADENGVVVVPLAQAGRTLKAVRAALIAEQTAFDKETSHE